MRASASATQSQCIPSPGMYPFKTRPFCEAYSSATCLPWLYRNDVVEFQGGLTDYLIKVVPKWIKFGVAGPAQSNNTYQEPTLYTTPEHLVPLCRWGGGRM